jgi:hypothetical protein
MSPRYNASGIEADGGGGILNSGAIVMDLRRPPLVFRSWRVERLRGPLQPQSDKPPSAHRSKRKSPRPDSKRTQGQG